MTSEQAVAQAQQALATLKNADLGHDLGDEKLVRNAAAVLVGFVGITSDTEPHYWAFQNIRDDAQSTLGEILTRTTQPSVLLAVIGQMAETQCWYFGQSPAPFLSPQTIDLIGSRGLGLSTGLPSHQQIEAQIALAAAKALGETATRAPRDEALRAIEILRTSALSHRDPAVRLRSVKELAWLDKVWSCGRWRSHEIEISQRALEILNQDGLASADVNVRRAAADGLNRAAISLSQIWGPSERFSPAVIEGLVQYGITNEDPETASTSVRALWIMAEQVVTQASRALYRASHEFHPDPATLLLKKKAAEDAEVFARQALLGLTTARLQTLTGGVPSAVALGIGEIVDALVESVCYSEPPNDVLGPGMLKWILSLR